MPSDHAMTTASPFPGERPSRCLRLPNPLLPSLLSSSIPRAPSFHGEAQRLALSSGSGGNAIAEPSGWSGSSASRNFHHTSARLFATASWPSFFFQSIPMMQRKTRARYHYPSAESSRRRRSRSAARLTAIAAAAHYSRTPGPSFPCNKCNPSATGIARRHLSASRVGCLFPCVRGSPLSLRPPAAVAVPGPIAGAGLPALAVAGGALWLFRKLRSPRQ